jgi:hypothetical protein
MISASVTAAEQITTTTIPPPLRIYLPTYAYLGKQIDVRCESWDRSTLADRRVK